MEDWGEYTVNGHWTCLRYYSTGIFSSLLCSPGTPLTKTETRKQLPTLQSSSHSLFFCSLSSTMCTHTPPSSLRWRQRRLVESLTDCSRKVIQNQNLNIKVFLLMMTYTDSMNYWTWSIDLSTPMTIKYHSDKSQRNQPTLQWRYTNPTLPHQILKTSLKWKKIKALSSKFWVMKVMSKLTLRKEKVQLYLKIRTSLLCVDLHSLILHLL